MRTFPLDSRRLGVWGLMAGLVLAALSVGVGSASTALAHDSIVSSNPARGETVTKTLSAVRITFSDELTDLDGAQTATIWVTDAEGGHHESGCVTLNGAVAMTQVALGEAGEYEVDWQVVSSDGHQSTGSYTFVWQPAAVTMAAPAFDAAPACGDGWSGQQASTTPTMSGSATPSDSPTTAPGGSTPDAAAAVPVTPTPTPEPTMTIMSAAPASANDNSSLVVPITIAVAIAGLAGVAAVVVSLMRRSRASGDRSGGRSGGRGRR